MHLAILLSLGLIPLVICAPQYGTPPEDHEHPQDPPGPDLIQYDGTDANAYADYHINDWAEGAVTEYPIHNSCNGSEAALLRKALYEAEVLAAHARDHILRWGSSSSHYKKYFGSAATVEPSGWYNKIVNGDKGGVLFRCDNIDGNCVLDGWAGHWRGENATGETVICPLSYTARWPLAGMCMYGYEVSSHEYTSYFASDIHHRLFHMPAVGEYTVDHYAEGYRAALELAVDHPEDAVRNTESLAFFALEVYAYDIAVPGEGCPGSLAEAPVEEEEEAAAPTPSSSSAEAIPASTTSAAPAECHTHSDGEVHCT
ncbi:Prenylated Rab acceptor protein 1 [Vermiconidia calcicola]|uniref:Prenylated Rab acceptor protein 1 n=1 Tax=Vermiconidia calcicola TaxID=1690605 RepID=A0ACC3MST0_9PEZI|nr:Prenylated Rab acceptor protein 1 [Vermiconidia calcicola]